MHMHVEDLHLLTTLTNDQRHGHDLLTTYGRHSRQSRMSGSRCGAGKLPKNAKWHGNQTPTSTFLPDSGNHGTSG